MSDDWKDEEEGRKLERKKVDERTKTSVMGGGLRRKERNSEGVSKLERRLDKEAIRIVMEGGQRREEWES